MSKNEPMPTNFEIEISRKRDRLAQLQNPMLRAMEYLKSPEYMQDSVATLEKISKVVQSGTMDQNQALLCVGRLQQILDDWKAQQKIVDEYNSLAKSLSLNQVSR